MGEGIGEEGSFPNNPPHRRRQLSIAALVTVSRKGLFCREDIQDLNGPVVERNGLLDHAVQVMFGTIAVPTGNCFKKVGCGDLSKGRPEKKGNGNACYAKEEHLGGRRGSEAWVEGRGSGSPERQEADNLT